MRVLQKNIIILHLLVDSTYVMCQASVPQFFRQCVAHINKICYFCSRNSKGEVLEWLKRHAWKACIRLKRIGGSNPPLSALHRELGP